MKLFFITGTDTGVGKSVSTLIIGTYLKSRNIPFDFIKIIETGVQPGSAPSDAGLLTKLLAEGDDIYGHILDLFELPASPYTAGKKEGRLADVEKILSEIKARSEGEGILLLEGAGGLQVPITKDYFMSDLIRDTESEAILCIRPGLGTLNHTLLSLEALKNRGIKVLGYLFNWTSPTAGGGMADYNMEDLAELTDVPCLGSIPYLNFCNKLEDLLEGGKDINWNLLLKSAGLEAGED